MNGKALAGFALVLALALAGLARADVTGQAALPGLSAQAGAQAGRGPVTNLPLPRFVSLKTSEGNARRGPSLSHRIDWVFRHYELPLLVTAEYGNWRRVEDRDGAGGWVHYSLLSGVRTVVVVAEVADLRIRAGRDGAVAARADAGAIARLGECLTDWCRISADGARGWVEKSALWGVGPDEIRD